jgi:hypothetical protein
MQFNNQRLVHSHTQTMVKFKNTKGIQYLKKENNDQKKIYVIPRKFLFSPKYQKQQNEQPKS